MAKRILTHPGIGLLTSLLQAFSYLYIIVNFWGLRIRLTLVLVVEYFYEKSQTFLSKTLSKFDLTFFNLFVKLVPYT